MNWTEEQQRAAFVFLQNGRRRETSLMLSTEAPLSAPLDNSCFQLDSIISLSEKWMDILCFCELVGSQQRFRYHAW